MALTSSDKDWERYGRDRPYFGALSESSYNAPDAAGIEAFFRSGEKSASAVFAVIRKHFQADWTPRRTLDFGCGPGRVLVAFARSAEHATGVDVSPSMLAVAARNCERLAIRNVDFVVSDDALSQVRGQYDFIHSALVFQHIPVKRGERIFRQLMNRLTPGGIAAIQVQLHRRATPVRKLVNRMRALRPFHYMVNLATGRPLTEPLMQMNEYSASILLDIAMEAGRREFYFVPDPSPSEWCGGTIYCR